MKNTYLLELDKLKQKLDQTGSLEPKDLSFKDTVEDFVRYNEIIGYPKHPATLKSQPLMPVQKEVFHIISTIKHNKVHLNKSRQTGWTETFLRLFGLRGFTKYAGKTNIIIPGTREKTTREIFGRFRELYKVIPDVVEESKPLFLRLKDNTEFHGMPANPEAVTGWTKIGGILMDESAKWNLTDDYPVINAIMPIVRTNLADLFMISTPKGPRGFFYHIEMEENDFFKMKYNIYVTQGWMYSKEQIHDMINSSVEDPNQEYLNQYVAGRNTIFGNTFATGDHEIEW